MELKTIDFSKRQFEANGTTYYIANKLTADRFFKLQELEFDVRFGFDQKQHNAQLRELYEMINQQQFADAAVTVYNMMQSIVDLGERYNPIYTYCTVFVNTEDEDVTVWDEKVAESKIKDWQAEGFDFNSFLSLALSIGSDLRKDYLKIIHNTSEQKTA